MSIINEKNTELSRALNTPIKIVEGLHGTEIVPGGQVVVVLGDKLNIFDDDYSYTKPIRVKNTVTVRGFIGAKEVCYRRIILGTRGLTPFKVWRLNCYVKETLATLTAGRAGVTKKPSPKKKR